MKFRRQHPVGVYVLDFYCSELHLAIEIDGGVHDDDEQASRDAHRQATLEERGIRFIRIPSYEVERDPASALKQLSLAIDSL